MLRIMFKNTEERYKSELLDTESKMRKLHDSVRNLTEYGNPSPKRRNARNQLADVKKPIAVKSSLPEESQSIMNRSPSSTENWKQTFKSKIGQLVVRKTSQKNTQNQETTEETPIFNELSRSIFHMAEGPPPPPPPPPPHSMDDTPPLLIGRKPSAFQAKQKLKFVEWEKINRIQETVWSELEKDMPNSKDAVMEYQLANAGVFDEVERAFAQKPSALKTTSPHQRSFSLLETKKAHNISKAKKKKKLTSYFMLNMC